MQSILSSFFKFFLSVSLNPAWKAIKLKAMKFTSQSTQPTLYFLSVNCLSQSSLADQRRKNSTRWTVPNNNRAKGPSKQIIKATKLIWTFTLLPRTDKPRKPRSEIKERSNFSHSLIPERRIYDTSHTTPKPKFPGKMNPPIQISLRQQQTIEAKYKHFTE